MARRNSKSKPKQHQRQQQDATTSVRGLELPSVVHQVDNTNEEDAVSYMSTSYLSMPSFIRRDGDDHVGSVGGDNNDDDDDVSTIAAWTRTSDLTRVVDSSSYRRPQLGQGQQPQQHHDVETPSNFALYARDDYSIRELNSIDDFVTISLRDDVETDREQPTLSQHQGQNPTNTSGEADKEDLSKPLYSICDRLVDRFLISVVIACVLLLAILFYVAHVR